MIKYLHRQLIRLPPSAAGSLCVVPRGGAAVQDRGRQLTGIWTSRTESIRDLTLNSPHITAHI